VLNVISLFSFMDVATLVSATMITDKRERALLWLHIHKDITVSCCANGTFHNSHS